MAVRDQVLTDDYALWNGDSCEVLPTLPDGSVLLPLLCLLVSQSHPNLHRRPKNQHHHLLLKRPRSVLWPRHQSRASRKRSRAP